MTTPDKMEEPQKPVNRDRDRPLVRNYRGGERGAERGGYRGGRGGRGGNRGGGYRSRNENEDTTALANNTDPWANLGSNSGPSDGSEKPWNSESQNAPANEDGN